MHETLQAKLRDQVGLVEKLAGDGQQIGEMFSAEFFRGISRELLHIGVGREEGAIHAGKN